MRKGPGWGRVRLLLKFLTYGLIPLSIWAVVQLFFTGASLPFSYLACAPLYVLFLRSLGRVRKLAPGKLKLSDPPEDLIFRFNEIRSKLRLSAVTMVCVRALDSSRPIHYPIRPLLGKVLVRGESWRQMDEQELSFGLAWCCLTAGRYSKSPPKSMFSLLSLLALAGALNPIAGLFVVCILFSPRKIPDSSASEQSQDAMKACELCGSAEAAVRYLGKLPPDRSVARAKLAIRRKYGLVLSTSAASRTQRRCSDFDFKRALRSANYYILAWIVIGNSREIIAPGGGYTSRRLGLELLVIAPSLLLLKWMWWNVGGKFRKQESGSPSTETA